MQTTTDPLARHTAHMDRMRKQPKLPQQPMYQGHQTKFKALQLVGDKLRAVTIIEQADQDFVANATPWELRFSTLTPQRDRLRATPVVDLNYMVVGHVVRVYNSQLSIPEKAVPDLSLLQDDGIPVYVDTNDMEGWRPLHTSNEMVYTVLVAIDGEVLNVIESSSAGYVEAVDCWLLDAVSVGGAVASIGKAAISRTVASLSRRAVEHGTRKTLTGRTVKRARELLSRATARVARGRTYIRATGMPPAHFKAMQDAASETRLIAVVRNTNVKCIPLIERGCPAKPLSIKANTSSVTGVVTGKTKQEFEIAIREGYYVVDVDGVARRTVVKGGKIQVEEQPLTGAFWKVEPGQFIHGGPPPKPLTGDYDLMGVFPTKSMGSNVSLRASNGNMVSDISGVYETQFRNVINSKKKLDRMRAMHGAQDQFAGFRGGATAFFPDGTVKYMDTAADVEAFYKSIGRQTAKGSYNSNTNSMSAPFDELAARRNGR
ncbi:anthrax toxin-like adenylyl cyclase domain-containing protein [Fuerstiella marisgermanici]|nr:anthrax toxin-like adenylyl cyclase domain-containing protein [Fuerstiella marisgermanici]